MTKWQVRVKWRVFNQGIFYDIFYVMAESRESAERLARNKLARKNSNFIWEKIDVFPANLRKDLRNEKL